MWPFKRKPNLCCICKHNVPQSIPDLCSFHAAWFARKWERRYK